MKQNRIINLSLATLALASSLSAIAGMPPLKPEKVLPPIHRTFLPAGFDSNDNAQVVVTGGYPTSCYMVGHTSYTVDHLAKKIEVQVTAFKRQSEYCLQVYTPFQEVVSVGLLEKGLYQVVVNQEPQTTRELKIAEAPSMNPDNHLYAPVSQIIRVGPRSFLARGTFNSSCMTLENVEVNYEPGEVIVVLPKAAYNGSCLEDNQPHAWEAPFQVRSDIDGEYLIHVRALNGAAVNSVQSFSTFDF